MKRYAVYYGAIIARHYKSGTDAIFEKWETAQEFSEHMNTINEGYFVAAVEIKPAKEKKK